MSTFFQTQSSECYSEDSSQKYINPTNSAGADNHHIYKQSIKKLREGFRAPSNYSQIPKYVNRCSRIWKYILLSCYITYLHQMCI